MFLETKNINKIYHNSSVPFQALVDINIQVPQGSIGALIGSSGSGKTTLLNIIGALDTATSGEVLIDGESITQKNSKELSLFRRNYLGFIFQSYNLIPVLTAYENVALSLFDTPEREKKDKVMNILSVVGLSSKENNYPNQLSGGQQQRVSIARALVKTPKVLLADEPTANLDSKTGYQILELISEINQKEKITVLFSTHDHRIMDIAQHSFLLKDGMIVKEK
ncbi:MAG: ABC transporter ATP-binding protein [Brevinema sp.]